MNDLQRPVTRGDCASSPRPCPWVSCKFHLLDITVDAAGRLRVAGRVGDEHAALAALESMSESCVLDIAERGAHSQEALAALVGVDERSIRRVERKAKANKPLRALLAEHAGEGRRRLPVVDFEKREEMLDALAELEPANDDEVAA